MKRKETYSGSEEPLSPEELEMLKNSVATGEDRSKLPPHDTSDKANAIRFAKKNPFLIVCAVIIALSIIAVAVCGVILAVKKLAARPNTDDYVIYLGTESYEADYDKVNVDGVLYIDMRKIASFAGFIVSGSKNKIKFTSAENNYLRFEDKSEFAVINGAKVMMPAVATVNESECLVPFSFVQKVIFEGLKIRLDTQTNTIKITRQLYKDTKEPADILFTTDGFSIIQAITPHKEKEITVDDYSIDIEPYLSYIVPEDDSPYLILANKENALGESYTPDGLVVLEDIGITSKDSSQQLCESAAYALKAMIVGMVADGVDIESDMLFVTSSYRSYEYQETLYNKYVSQYVSAGMTEDEARAEASKTSARPGESEHQTGLCFDFITKSMNGNLDATFEYTPAFEWLRDHAHLYGFILRYPSDKVELTGYDYEPWHYRFVGRNAAVEIYEAGICFEEYLELN